jgi:DNA repair protein RecO (recombination protein O)
MYRSISTNAIVIRRERMGEFHKNLSLLTSDLGLINATAYGAFKMQSRLRLGSEPFTWSQTQLYHNPVKRSYKVTEMEINASFGGLQSSVPRLAAASLWAEVVQKSYGAGELSGQLFPLLLASLQLLDAADDAHAPYITIQFLWRFLGLAGYQPDTSACDRCGAGLEGPHGAVYSASSSSLLCHNCSMDHSPSLPSGALRYLEATSGVDIARAMDIGLEDDSLQAVWKVLPLMVQSVLEGELTSLRLVGARA